MPVEADSRSSWVEGFSRAGPSASLGDSRKMIRSEHVTKRLVVTYSVAIKSNSGGAYAAARRRMGDRVFGALGADGDAS